MKKSLLDLVACMRRVGMGSVALLQPGLEPKEIETALRGTYLEEISEIIEIYSTFNGMDGEFRIAMDAEIYFCYHLRMLSEALEDYWYIQEMREDLHREEVWREIMPVKKTHFPFMKFGLNWFLIDTERSETFGHIWHLDREVPMEKIANCVDDWFAYIQACYETGVFTVKEGRVDETEIELLEDLAKRYRIEQVP